MYKERKNNNKELDVEGLYIELEGRKQSKSDREKLSLLLLLLHLLLSFAKSQHDTDSI